MTDWIRPGADVVLYNSGSPSGALHVTRTTIAKVAAKSFTVTEPGEPRFPIDRLQVHQGGTWGWTRNCVPAGSDDAQRVLAEARGRAMKTRARIAVDEWRSDPNPDTCRAAIDALRKLLDFEVGAS